MTKPIKTTLEWYDPKYKCPESNRKLIVFTKLYTKFRRAIFDKYFYSLESDDCKIYKKDILYWAYLSDLQKEIEDAK